MKKVFYPVIFLLCGILCFCLTGCPGDNIKDFDCISPQEFTAFMNSLDFGTTFTLKDYEYKHSSEFKTLVVYLEAQDLPGKTVCAYQNFCYSSFGDYRINTTARTTFPIVTEHRATDYYLVKYADEITAHFDSLFSPLTQGLEKNVSYRIAIKPILSNLELYTFTDARYDKIQYYQSAQDFIENNRGIYVYCLINKELSADPEYERKANAFFYDLQNNDKDFDSYYDKLFYFTEKYPASGVSAQSLADGSFYANDESVVVIGHLYVY